MFLHNTHVTKSSVNHEQCWPHTSDGRTWTRVIFPASPRHQESWSDGTVIFHADLPIFPSTGEETTVPVFIYTLLFRRESPSRVSKVVMTRAQL